jgi:molybdate transport system ATP-binding protein
MDEIVVLMHIGHLLDSSLFTLSNGEIRKTLIAWALGSDPEIMILDEPFDGLDTESKAHLSEILESLVSKGFQILLITCHLEEIPPSIAKYLVLENGKIAFQGKREEIAKEKLTSLISGKPPKKTEDVRSVSTGIPVKSNEPTIIMKNVNVTYGDKSILSGLTWTARRNEDWAIVGPNGAGKTTLLRLITADHPQAYTNEIWLFGKKRGSGETIWEIKERMGVLSPELQISYRINMRVIEVVLSGFWDSIGLYRYATPRQEESARGWLDFLGIADLTNAWFSRLSYGEKRMVLLARALVKSPQMLVLDEPCQGLDPHNAKTLVDLVTSISKNTGTQIIFVTHRLDELPSSITHILEFKRIDTDEHGNEQYRTEARAYQSCID